MQAYFGCIPSNKVLQNVYRNYFINILFNAIKSKREDGVIYFHSVEQLNNSLPPLYFNEVLITFENLDIVYAVIVVFYSKC